MKILVADASDSFRKELYERIRQVPTASVVGQAAHEGQAVLAAALCRPDVVLTDVYLATGTGFSTLERLRQAGFDGTAYIVTHEDEAEHGPKCLQFGIDGFYHKAHDLDRLIHALSVLATAPTSFSQTKLERNRLLSASHV